MKILPCNADISRYKVAEFLLEEGVVMVRILRKRPGVILPTFLDTPIVNLNFSYRYGIDDFAVDERGIRASLSFRKIPHFCDVPWSSVCAIMSEKTDQMFVWADVFDKNELRAYMPPDLVSMLDDIKTEDLLSEFPELEDFLVKPGDGLTFAPESTEEPDDESSKENESDDEEEDDDDIPPGGFGELHFV